MTISQRIISKAIPVALFVAVFLIGAIACIYLARSLLLVLLEVLDPIIPDARIATHWQRLLFSAALWFYYTAVILVLPCWAAWRCSRRVRQLLI
jgi:hypothetical protein